jgi:predicted GIY-YIG superfamily endonuclease
MAWVYILRGPSGRHYIGSTTDLTRRIEQHQHGHTYSTRRLGSSLDLVASLQLDSLAKARALEREMKRKKNLRLALLLLESRRQAQQISG